MDEEVDRNAETKENDEVDRNAETKENNEVDRNAETKENNEVDRNADTKEEEVDRNKDTQEDESPAIILRVHSLTTNYTKDPHLGFKPPKVPSPLIPLQVGQLVIFGRGEGVDLFLNDDTASRRHMKLTAQLSVAYYGQYLKFKVKNLSTKPVIINNVILNEGAERLLNSLDVISIGVNTFTVDINPTKFNHQGKYFLEVQLPQDHHQPNNNGVNGYPVNQVNSGMPPQGMVPTLFPYGMGIPGMAAQNIPHQQAMMPPQQLGMGFPSQGMISHQNYQMPGTMPGMPGMQQQHPIMPHVTGNSATNIAHNFITGNYHTQPQQEQAHFSIPSFPSAQQVQPSQQISLSSTGSVSPMAERQLSAEERREAYGQRGGREPSENDDNGNLSMEETSKQCETSFEETQPPKDKD